MSTANRKLLPWEVTAGPTVGDGEFGDFDIGIRHPDGNVLLIGRAFDKYNAKIFAASLNLALAARQALEECAELPTTAAGRSLKTALAWAGYVPRIVPGDIAEGQPPVTARRTDPAFRFNAQDVKYLKSLRISVDDAV
jgi:hypothetical protein